MIRAHALLSARALLPLLLLSLTQPARAAEPDSLQLTAQRIADQFNGNPSGFSPWFTATFLQAVPEPQLAAIFQSLYSKYGAVRHILPNPDNTPASGKFTFEFTDVQLPVTLSIESAAPHRVISLFFANPSPRLRSLDEVQKRLAALPGQVTCQLQSLDSGKIILSLNPDKPLAIGSAFKLYILAELLRQKIPWDKIITLDEQYKSLPSGDLATWPTGSPLTIHTVALKMISQSDNTAADHLLALVTREKVQADLAVLGMKSPDLNIPFLSTRDLFRFKSDPDLRKEFLSATPAAKTALLTRIAALPALTVATLLKDNKADFLSGKPVDIEHFEWFASASDLCRLLKWFDTTGDKTALAILAVNPGLAISKSQFPFVGFKGGSEPGVLNLTMLLHSAAGHRYALSASWNNPAKEVDLEEFSGLLLAAIDLIEPPATAPVPLK